MARMSTVMAIMSMAFFLWIMFSFVDVLSHNDPVFGDRNYSRFNSFVILEEVGR